MRISIRKDNHPNNEDLITSLLVAIQFLNPENNKEDVLMAVLNLLSDVADRKKLLLLTDDVCKSANTKFNEIKSLYEMYELETEINN
jgi:hypothetical protein